MSKIKTQYDLLMKLAEELKQKQIKSIRLAKLKKIDEKIRHNNV